MACVPKTLPGLKANVERLWTVIAGVGASANRASKINRMSSGVRATPPGRQARQFVTLSQTLVEKVRGDFRGSTPKQQGEGHRPYFDTGRENGECPTPKQLQYAETLAAQRRIKVPENVQSNKLACSAFITKLLGTDYGLKVPSDAQTKMIQGTLINVMDPESFPSGFVKRAFIVRTDVTYPQEVKFELFKDKISLIDSYQVNDQVKVSFNINGRKWEGKYFTNLQAWRIDGAGGEGQQMAPQVGTLINVMEPESFPSGLVKRAFIVRTDGTYPQEVKFELLNDKISLIDSYQVNDQVKVSFNIKGRKWEGKYFTILQAWRIDAAGGEGQQMAPQRQTQGFSEWDRFSAAGMQASIHPPPGGGGWEGQVSGSSGSGTLNVLEEMAVEDCEYEHEVLEIVGKLCGDDDTTLQPGQGASASALDVQEHLSKKFDIHTDELKVQEWLNALVDRGLLKTSEDSKEFWLPHNDH